MISVFWAKFGYSQYIFTFKEKIEPQYIVPALFFPCEINQWNITPFDW